MEHFGAFLRLFTLAREYPGLTCLAAFMLLCGILHDTRILIEILTVLVKRFKHEVDDCRTSLRVLRSQLTSWDDPDAKSTQTSIDEVPSQANRGTLAIPVALTGSVPSGSASVSTESPAVRTDSNLSRQPLAPLSPGVSRRSRRSNTHKSVSAASMPSPIVGAGNDHQTRGATAHVPTPDFRDV